MVLLTKLNNSKVLVSLASIKYLEAVPDTLIFFLNGDSLMVKESLEEIRLATVELAAEHSIAPA